MQHQVQIGPIKQCPFNHQLNMQQLRLTEVQQTWEPSSADSCSRAAPPVTKLAQFKKSGIIGPGL